MQNYINNLVVLADILGRCGHDIIHDFAEQGSVSSGITSYARDKLCDGLLVLKEMSDVASDSSGMANFVNILQVNYQHLLFAVGDPLLEQCEEDYA